MSNTVASRRWPAPTLVTAMGIVAAVTVGSIALRSLGAFPESWNVHLADPINDARGWLISNQRTHWLYSAVLNPISSAIDWAISLLESVLHWLPWFSYPVFAGLGLWWVNGRRAGALAAVAVLYFGIVEIWEDSLDTLALMAVAVSLAMIVGVPAGVAVSRSDRMQRIARPLLDAMQTMPGFVYLIPFTLLFGVGLVPALLSTLIFALPPVIRATDLGIRNLPTATVEAAEMFGATERQTLTKVQLPLARPAILVGANQTINLSLSMVVIAALIGAGGLGGLVLDALRKVRVGDAAEAGLGIVAMAILLDRFFAGLADTDSRHDTALVSKLAIVAVPLAIVGGLVGANAFPDSVSWHFADPIDRAVKWAQINLFDINDSGIGTGPFSDFITIWFITPLRELLSSGIPWLVLIAGFAVTALWLKGWQLALGVTAALGLIGFLGMWELSMDTLAQCLVAVVITLLIGVPIGILTAQSDRIRSGLRPFLDFLQTIPSFVLLVPVIGLFNIGRVPGILASVIYALPVAVHYTDLGLRGVPVVAREAAESFGASTWQRLRKVDLPIAAPQIMTAVNQTIMLVLAMVVIAGLVGGGGLGFETVRALRRTDSVGTGFEAGIAIVILAGILDRFTGAIAERLRPIER